MDSRKAVAVFGSTGSVGVSTIDVVQRNNDCYRIAALTANKNVDLLEAQCVECKPDYAAMADADAASELCRRLAALSVDTKVLAGPEALDRLAADPKIPVVMAAIVGFAGLNSTLVAARSGKRILLANKESLVVAGPLLTEIVQNTAETSIVPVDSEHNAIFQCLPARHQGGAPVKGDSQIQSLVLTASGGPFRLHTADQMRQVTVAQAVSHPNWNMGRKISVDSATMMNKGLEVIEACYLFGVEEQQIEVLIHPQSVIHSMVRYRDGSVLAQLGETDMRTPIANALAWPDRINAGVGHLDFKTLGSLEFSAPDEQRFPCLGLARRALRDGRGANVVLNAANEVAVDKFLNEHIAFTEIAVVNKFVMDHCNALAPKSVADLKAMDKTARSYARDFIDNGLKSPGMV